MKEHLLKLGFEQRLPWQFHDDSYQITILRNDSYNFSVVSITNKRFDEVVFRGRIRNAEEFYLILTLVKEDYDLTDEEKEQLKIVGWTGDGTSLVS